jgi:hypothetical protein
MPYKNKRDKAAAERARRARKRAALPVPAAPDPTPAAEPPHAARSLTAGELQRWADHHRLSVPVVAGLLGLSGKAVRVFLDPDTPHFTPVPVHAAGRFAVLSPGRFDRADLLAWRTASGLSVEAAAVALDVDPSGVRRIEAGRCLVPARVALVLAGGAPSGRVLPGRGEDCG